MSRDAAAITIVGRAGTHPQVSVGSTGDRVNFRVVATERRFDRALDDWVDGDEFGVTVVCWKALADAVLHSVRKGDPVVVTGRISTRRFEKNGSTAYFTEVKADFIGLDLVRAGSRFVRKPSESRAAPDPSGQPAAPEHGAEGREPDRSSEQRFGTDPDDFRSPWDVDGSAGVVVNGALSGVD